MQKYLEETKRYWDRRYEAENVEGWVFRMYGQILKAEFSMDGSGGEKLLDFGCGEGGALVFFKRKGFDVYGVDVSEPAIAVAKEKMPDITDHFQVIDPKPHVDDLFFTGDFDIITAIQSLYYYDNNDLDVRVRTLYDMLKPGGFVYFTMMSKKCWFFEYATAIRNGLYRVEFETDRLRIKDYYMLFVEDEEDLREKFHLFKPLHIGFYSYAYRSDEGMAHHYTFFGRKE